MPVQTPEDLFERQLGEMLSAEATFLDGMRVMERKATDPQLKQALAAHVPQTERQMENLREAFRKLGRSVTTVACPPAQALVEDYRRALLEIPEGGERRIPARTLVDAETAAAAARVEHFEVGAYRALIAGARKLDKEGLVPLLEENLRMEESAARQAEDLLSRLP